MWLMSNTQEKQDVSDHQAVVSHSNLKRLVQGEFHLIHVAGRGNVWRTQLMACRELATKDVHIAMWYAQCRAALDWTAPCFAAFLRWSSHWRLDTQHARIALPSHSLCKPVQSWLQYLHGFPGSSSSWFPSGCLCS